MERRAFPGGCSTSSIAQGLLSACDIGAPMPSRRCVRVEPIVGMARPTG